MLLNHPKDEAFFFCSDKSSGLDSTILRGKKNKTGDPSLFDGSEDPLCVSATVYVSGFHFPNDELKRTSPCSCVCCLL